MNPLTSKEIVDNLRLRNGWTTEESQNFWNVFLENFYQGLKKDEKVVFSRFGSFKVRHKKERVARNPRTLAPAIVSARNVVKFVPSEELKMRARGK